MGYKSKVWCPDCEINMPGVERRFDFYDRNIRCKCGRMTHILVKPVNSSQKHEVDGAILVFSEVRKGNTVIAGEIDANYHNVATL